MYRSNRSRAKGWAYSNGLAPNHYRSRWTRHARTTPNDPEPNCTSLSPTHLTVMLSYQYPKTEILCPCGARLERRESELHNQPVRCGGKIGCGRWHSCSYCVRRHFSESDKHRCCTQFGMGKGCVPLDEDPNLKRRKTRAMNYDPVIRETRHSKPNQRQRGF